MKVFLGGTCAGYDWRSKLIPLLKCDYFNPVVKNWTEERRKIEVHEREVDDIILYVITKDISGVYSIAEITDDSNKRPEKVIFCNLYMAGRTTSSLTKKEEEMAHSLVAVENLVKENKVPVFTSLQSTANYINKLTRESSSKEE